MYYRELAVDFLLVMAALVSLTLVGPVLERLRKPSKRVRSAEVFDYDDRVVIVSECNAGCVGGQLSNPSRECGKCGGTGITREVLRRSNGA